MIYFMLRGVYLWANHGYPWSISGDSMDFRMGRSGYLLSILEDQQNAFSL